MCRRFLDVSEVSFSPHLSPELGFQKCHSTSHSFPHKLIHPVAKPMEGVNLENEEIICLPKPRGRRGRGSVFLLDEGEAEMKDVFMAPRQVRTPARKSP